MSDVGRLIAFEGIRMTLGRISKREQSDGLHHR